MDGPPQEHAQLSRFNFGAGDARFADVGDQEMMAVTLAIAMAASLFLAYTVTLWASYRWISLGNQHEETKEKAPSYLERAYRGLIFSR